MNFYASCKNAALLFLYLRASLFLFLYNFLEDFYSSFVRRFTLFILFSTFSNFFHIFHTFLTFSHLPTSLRSFFHFYTFFKILSCLLFIFSHLFTLAFISLPLPSFSLIISQIRAKLSSIFSLFYALWFQFHRLWHLRETCMTIQFSSFFSIIIIEQLIDWSVLVWRVKVCAFQSNF